MDWTAALRLDSDSPVPLYRQLQETIASLIRSGRLADGARLLPTRELAGLLGLNRTTVAAAYEALESEGLLKAWVGRGSYVRSPVGPAFDWQERFRGPLPERALPGIPAGRDDGWISFASSRPDPEIFPVETVRLAAEQELSERGELILQLGAPEGYPRLREFLASSMREAGHAADNDEILITSGCQQSLDLIAKVLVRPGDTVLLEDPVYPGARDLFRAAGAQLRGIGVGATGLSLDELESELNRGEARLLLVTPNFQNPTGATLPLDARRDLLRLAARFRLAVVENDVYAGLRYRGPELPSLKSLDHDGRVIYLSSFSKIAFPGLRVGWCVAARAVVRRLTAAKQLADLHTDQLSQAVLDRLARDGALEQHRQSVVWHGAHRRKAALEAVRAALPEAEFVEPEGGMHLWLRLPPPLDSTELLAQARLQKILFIPGPFFSVERPQSAALRLSFAGLPPEKIQRGVATLGRLVHAGRGGAGVDSESILV